MRKLLLLIPLTALMAGCASLNASDKAVDRPGLDVPPPPARIIDVAPIDLPPEPVAELPQPGSPPVTAPPRSSRPNTSRPTATTEPKPDPKAAEAPVDPPKETPKPPDPNTQLRTPQTADTSGAARTVKGTIDTARGILNGVNFGPLSNERKKAYNDAKLLIQQADDALKQGNLVYAQGLAAKAETLARELAGR